MDCAERELDEGASPCHWIRHHQVSSEESTPLHPCTTALPGAAKVTFHKERERESERWIFRKVLTETSLVMKQPRFASLRWKGALPAASASPQQEQQRTQAKHMLSQAPDVSGHKLQRGETHHAPARHPELEIPAQNERCTVPRVYLLATCISLSQALCHCLCLAHTSTHVSNSWPTRPHSYLLTGPPCAP